MIQFAPDVQAYEHFYLSQVGGNGFFDGNLPHLQGYGLGGILGKVFRFAMPIVKRGLQFLAPHAARVGSQVLNDVTSGENLGHSIKHRGSDALTGIAQQLLSNMSSQSGRGRKRRAHAVHGPPPRKLFKAIKLPPNSIGTSHFAGKRGRRRVVAHHDIFGKN
jgi:hypothetical protein